MAKEPQAETAQTAAATTVPENYAWLMRKLPSPMPAWPPWLVLTLCALLSIGALVLDLHQPRNMGTGTPYIAIILFSSFASRRMLTFGVALACFILVVLGYYASPGDADQVIGIINRTKTIAVMALVAAVLIHRIGVQEQRDAAVRGLAEAFHRLKVLHGLLPICSSCKKIKTNRGQWRQLESYIQDHSEAEFTHGICEDCAAKVYGEYGKHLDDEASTT